MSGDRKEIKLHDPAAEGGGEEEDLVNFPLVGQSLSVLRRVRALKKLQLAQIDLEVKFHDRITQLEKEFQPLFAEINQKVAFVGRGVACAHCAYSPSPV